MSVPPLRKIIVDSIPTLSVPEYVPVIWVSFFAVSSILAASSVVVPSSDAPPPQASKVNAFEIDGDPQNDLMVLSLLNKMCETIK